MEDIIWTTARNRQVSYHNMGLGRCSEEIANRVFERYMTIPIPYRMRESVIDRVQDIFAEEEDKYIKMMEVLKKEYGM